MTLTSSLDFIEPGPLSPSLSTLLLSISPFFVHALLTHLSLQENTWLIRLAIAPVQVWLTWRLMGGIAFSDPLMLWMNNIFGTIWMILLITLPRCLLPQPYRFKHPYAGLSFLSGLHFTFNILGDCFHPINPYFVPSVPYPPSSSSSPLARTSPLVIYILCHVPPVVFLAFAIKYVPSMFEDDFSILRSGWSGIGTSFAAGMIAWCFLTACWCLNNWFHQSTRETSSQPRGNLMNSPWKSTSVHEFWSDRWHALLLPTILFYKALLLPPTDQPSGMKRRSTRFGTPFLGFFITALFHDNLIYPIANTNRPRLGYTSLFFLLQPFALLLERAFLHMSGGKKVSGPIGWMWTFAWLGYTGRYLAEGYVRMGLLRQLKPLARYFADFVRSSD